MRLVSSLSRWFRVRQPHPAGSVTAVAASPAVSPDHLRAVIEHGPDGLILLDADWRLVFLNRGAARQSGRSRDLTTGQPVWTLFPDAATGPLRDAWARCMTERVIADAEQVCPSLGRHIAARAIPVAGGGIAIHLRDVTAAWETDAALATERARLDATFAAAQVGLSVFDEQLRVVRHNEILAAMDGRAAAECIGRRLRDLAPGVAATVEPVLQKVLETGEPATGLEMRGETPDAPGRRRTFLSNYWPVRDSQAVRGVVASIADITERKAVEASLHERETQLQLAAAGAGLGTWRVDVAASTIEFSDQAAAMLGLATPLVSFDTFRACVHPEDLPAVSAVWQEVLSQPEPRAVTYRTTRKAADGGVRWVMSRGAVWADKPGRPVRGYGILIDVTDRYRAEQALLESEARFEDVANAAPVLIWIADTDRRCTWFNRPWLVFTGRRMAQELGDGWAEGVHPDDLAGCMATFADAFDRRSAFQMEYRLRRADGAWRVISDRGVPRFTAMRGFLGYIGCCVDVTEAREAAAELRQMNDTLEARIAERVAELAAANHQLVAQIEERERVEATMRQMQRLDAVGQITAGVAHDFNNLLAVIIGNLDHAVTHVEADPDRKPMQEMLRAAIEAAEKGAALTRQLLAFSRRQKLDPRPVDLNEVLAGMHDLLQISAGGLVELRMNHTPDLWPALVDTTQLASVILNLAINARDAMADGGALTIATENLPPGDPAFPSFLAPGDYVVVSVADTGAGMSDEVKARAFEPFFTTKPVGKGSGLGLSQVYGFAKQSNGGVLIDSSPGRGTRVRILLPRTATLAGEPPTPARRAVRTGPGAGSPRRCRILVVDDDSAVRQVTAMTLGRHGYDVVTAGSGGAALDLLARDGGATDLMVLDFAMPGMNGVEVAREARTMRPDLPVLFLTAYAGMAALDGVDPRLVLAKPFRDHELVERACVILGHAGTEQAARPVP